MYLGTIRKYMLNFTPYTHVLIIRVWEESSEGSNETDVWRCVVEDVDHKERFYFNSVGKLMAFLVEKIAPGKTR